MAEGSGDKRRGGPGGRRGGHGGFKKKRLHKRDFGKKGSRPNVWSQDQGGGNRLSSKDQLTGDETYELKPFQLSNESFETYYKGQGFLKEDEWDAFMQVLRTQLPATFRINGSGNFANAIRDKLRAEVESNFAGLVSEGGEVPRGKVVVDGEVKDPMKPLAWYPGGYGWQMQYSRNQIRKLESLERFHDFLKRENEAGNITRQETASMIPPFFLDVTPQSRILDMCAAPGSKTFQLLEMIHAGEGVPTGYVVANDSDAKRCNLLTHQTKRMCSPSLLITNHMGQRFPTLPGGPIFDRILCDVPCSGDGTLRKAPDLWRRWNLSMGMNLHKLQLQIACKAAELLEVGGRLVYSTCR